MATDVEHICSSVFPPCSLMCLVSEQGLANLDLFCKLSHIAPRCVLVFSGCFEVGGRGESWTFHLQSLSYLLFCLLQENVADSKFSKSNGERNLEILEVG